MSDNAPLFDFDATPETFTAPFEFRPLAGKPVKLTIEWRHKTQAEFAAWLASAPKHKDADLLGEVIAGWSGLARDFSAEALADWINKHPNAALQLLRGYREALFGARQGN